ncbi:hypothetical protein MBH78_18455 [Oceanimonas sp. NS1]|nr:hypothetical protein [Oceanimonas sp. NS1]
MALPPTQLAQAFVNTRPFVTSNLIGATSLTQLKENLDSVHVVLTEELQQGIADIHQQYPNPAP